MSNQEKKPKQNSEPKKTAAQNIKSQAADIEQKNKYMSNNNNQYQYGSDRTNREEEEQE